MLYSPEKKFTDVDRMRNAYFTDYQRFRHFQSCENHNSDFG